MKIGPRLSKTLIAVIGIGCAALAAPGSGWSQTQTVAERNATWEAKMTSLLKLTPMQQAALRAFVEISAKSRDVIAPSAAQLRAMSFVEQADFWAAQTKAVQARAQADADALHAFYALLTAAQRGQFDSANRPREVTSTIAADVISVEGSDEPDYRQPAHIDATWLVKPSADNVARVYPSAAVEAHITGKVVLHCTVDEDGYLADCIVASEQPMGHGFGNAALEMTAYMRMQPATNYGVAVRSPINVPVAFNLPDPD